MANTTCLDKFENILKIIEHVGGHIGTKNSLTDAELDNEPPSHTR